MFEALAHAPAAEAASKGIHRGWALAYFGMRLGRLFGELLEESSYGALGSRFGLQGGREPKRGGEEVVCSDVAMHSASACEGGLILYGLTSGLHTLNPSEATMGRRGAATLCRCNYSILFWLRRSGYTNINGGSVSVAFKGRTLKVGA